MPDISTGVRRALEQSLQCPDCGGDVEQTTREEGTFAVCADSEECGTEVQLG